jgi:hypothetical protein
MRSHGRTHGRRRRRRDITAFSSGVGIGVGVLLAIVVVVGIGIAVGAILVVASLTMSGRNNVGSHWSFYRTSSILILILVFVGLCGGLAFTSSSSLYVATSRWNSALQRRQQQQQQQRSKSPMEQ